MPYPCSLVPSDKPDKQPGDMWFSEIRGDDETGYYCEEGRLSDEYVRDWKDKRLPLIVIIPAKGFPEDTPGTIYPYPFGVDTSTSSGDRRHGWTVTGEAPNITVTPSIHLPGHYHGWLTNGVLSEG